MLQRCNYLWTKIAAQGYIYTIPQLQPELSGGRSFDVIPRSRQHGKLLINRLEMSV